MNDAIHTTLRADFDVRQQTICLSHQVGVCDMLCHNQSLAGDP
ncbi:MAG: hypothetical protein ACAI44_38125 [Candidatus Sericytochromatia bacterium]